MAIISVAASAQLLWRVQYPGSDNVSYVLGTHHLAPVAMLDSIPGLREAMAGIDTVYGEIDMAKMPEADNVAMLKAAVIAPADSTLEVLLTGAQLDSLGSVMTRVSGMKMTGHMLSSLKPVAVRTTILTMMMPRLVKGAVAGQSIDNAIQIEAHNAGKVVRGLETIQQQTDLLYNTPLARQAEELVEFIENIDEQTALLKEVTDAYMRQDFPELARLLLSDKSMSASEASRLIYDRNLAWTTMLNPVLKDQRALIAVGAAHLAGPFGVLEKLRRYGYDVTPVLKVQ